METLILGVLHAKHFYGRLITRITMLLSFLLYLSCAPKQQSKRVYRVSAPSREWKEVKEGGADRAWYNPKLQGIIYVDSNCDKKFEDRRLDDSYKSLTKGITIGQPIRKSTLTIDERDALFITQNGVVDGVPIRVGVVLISKNQCLYDFIYIAPRPNFVQGVDTLLSVAQSLNTNRFKTEGLIEGNNVDSLLDVQSDEFLAPQSENKDIENKDIENKDIENKDIENKDIEKEQQQ